MNAAVLVVDRKGPKPPLGRALLPLFFRKTGPLLLVRHSMFLVARPGQVQTEEGSCLSPQRSQLAPDARPAAAGPVPELLPSHEHYGPIDVLQMGHSWIILDDFCSQPVASILRRLGLGLGLQVTSR